MILIDADIARRVQALGLLLRWPLLCLVALSRVWKLSQAVALKFPLRPTELLF